MPGCTHNGGDISPWGGSWHIESVSLDGEQQNLDPNDVGAAYYLQFQGSVVCLRYTDGLHDGGASYGSWSESDGGVDIAFDPNSYDVALLPPAARYTATFAGSRHVALTTTTSDGQALAIALAKQ